MKPWKLLIFVLAAAGSADCSWIRLTSAHFEVLSDASESTARKVVARLEDGHAVFGQETGLRVTPLPVRVFVMRSEREFALVRPSSGARGFFQSGADRDYIVLSTAGDLERTPVHELVHLVRFHTSRSGPRWLEEGLADYYSTFGAGGLGRPVEEHLGVLRTMTWRTAEDIASRVKSIRHDDGGADGLFYAQSWILVSMLRQSPRYKTGFREVVAALESGLSSDAAFRRVYGVSFGDAMRDAREFLDAGRFPGERVAWVRPIAFPVKMEALGGEAAEVVRADLFLRMGKPEESEKQIRKIKVSGATDAATLTQLALYSLNAGRDAEAAGYLLKATQMADAPASAFFEYAMLLRDQRADEAKVEDLLRRTVSLSPAHGEAQFLLGEIAYRRRDIAGAIQYYRSAVAVFPRRSSFWHALALASKDDGDPEGARAAALRALESAVLPHEVEMAQALVNP